MNQGVTEILNKLDRLNERLGRIERRLDALEKPTGAPIPTYFETITRAGEDDER